MRNSSAIYDKVAPVSVVLRDDDMTQYSILQPEVVSWASVPPGSGENMDVTGQTLNRSDVSIIASTGVIRLSVILCGVENFAKPRSCRKTDPTRPQPRK